MITGSMTHLIDSASRHCIIVVDSPGCVDDAVASRGGTRIVVVSATSAKVRARQLGAAVISGARSARIAVEAGIGPGVFVVSDTAFELIPVVFRDSPIELVVLECIESLRLPNSSHVQSHSVWMTTVSSRRAAVSHKGWARECYESALASDSVVRRSRFPLVPVATRHLYYDCSIDESDVISLAIDAGDTETAASAFPGPRASSAPSSHVSDSECPVCFETPSTRVTTQCCRRQFCLSCINQSIKSTGRSCPWCRRPTGLWNCTIDTEYRAAPFKDALVSDLVNALSRFGDAVLVVTTDCTYQNRSRVNPIAAHLPVCLGRTSCSALAAVVALDQGDTRVVVADPSSIRPDGLLLSKITQIISTEASCIPHAHAWSAACPNARGIHLMVSIVDAVHPRPIPL